MAQQVANNTITFRDLRGHTGKCGVHVSFDRTVASSLNSANNAVAAWFVEVEALSNGAVVGSTGVDGTTNPPNVYGASAQFANAEDKAVIRLLAADNTIHTISIPCPVLSMFEADQETVKGSAIATMVATLTAAPVNSSFLCTRAGSPFVASLGGRLARRKFQRKLTIYDKSANLDEPEE